jgi:hypothetical protein
VELMRVAALFFPGDVELVAAEEAVHAVGSCVCCSWTRDGIPVLVLVLVSVSVPATV